MLPVFNKPFQLNRLIETKFKELKTSYEKGLKGRTNFSLEVQVRTTTGSTRRLGQKLRKEAKRGRTLNQTTD